jgi:hypothetical protein
MLVSQKLAIAAHLHVLLRRKTGRVTDTEWMATNLEYAMEIVRFSRAKAQEDVHPELAEWADKLERAVLEPGSGKRPPLAQAAAQMLRERHAASAPSPTQPMPPSSGYGQSTFGETGFQDSTQDGGSKPRDPDSPRYVGGIR